MESTEPPPQSNNVNINDLSEVQIKALLYDQIVALDRTQANIKILQEQLQKISQKVGE